MGALTRSASASTSSRAPCTPAPVNRVTVSASSIISARRPTGPAAGWTAPNSVARSRVIGPSTSWSATSPGSTITDTPRFAIAVWTAMCSRVRPCSPELTSSQKWEHSANRASGWVSWKKPVPMVAEGMWEAIASTGAPSRWASKRPWTRWVLPGPQEPAQTASFPVTRASAPAAKAPASSLRTCTHSMPSVVRTASTTGFSESPTTP